MVLLFIAGALKSAIGLITNGFADINFLYRPLVYYSRLSTMMQLKLEMVLGALR